MAVHRYKDLTTWQVTEEFKRAVFKIIRESSEGWRDLRFRGQIVGSARGPSKHVAEGFMRKSPGEFARYLDYAVSSIAETEGHLTDGIDLGYFPEADCQEAFRWAKRCSVAVMNLKHSQVRRAEEDRQKRRRRSQAPEEPGSL